MLSPAKNIYTFLEDIQKSRSKNRQLAWVLCIHLSKRIT